MTRTELLARAQAITGRFPLGRVGVSEGAYELLGAERCLELLQRYADQKEGEEAGYYEVDDWGYLITTLPRSPGARLTVTYFGDLDEMIDLLEADSDRRDSGWDAELLGQ